MKPKIQKAIQADFDKVYDILMHKEVNPFMNYPILAKAEFEQIWVEIFEKIYLWKEDENILGMIAITKGTHRVKHIAYIEKLAINQSIKRKGLGTIFFDEIINQLTQENITKIELNVETDNERAINFYKKLGFEIEGIRKKALNREGDFIDNYFMAKML